jgi:N-succinyldiaminopimelate aminotransferase
MNPAIHQLHPYPFERLARLKAGIEPPAGLHHIPLSIGEPRHPAPAFVAEALISHLHALETYPATRGGGELRAAGAAWLERRFALAPGSLDPERHVLPVSGTREALFACAQALVDRGREPLVLMPNPFYQIYEGAALLAGGVPRYIPCTEATGFLPDLDAVPEGDWQRCQLLYLCTPGNPSGAVHDLEQLRRLVELAQRHDFVIASDECYSEIYPDEGAPPPGLLQAAAAAGVEGFRRCLVFHSLSKRSNLPGLRSGLVAGDPDLIAGFLRYRTYQGCAMPLQAQAASVQAWSDEAHVRENRELYRRKFDAVLAILDPVLDLQRPAGGFYLWPKTPIPDADFAAGLYRAANVTVLPGSFLSRAVNGHDPGAGHVRMALVAPLEDCVEAATRIRDYVATLP